MGQIVNTSLMKEAREKKEKKKTTIHILHCSKHNKNKKYI